MLDPFFKALTFNSNHLLSSPNLLELIFRQMISRDLNKLKLQQANQEICHLASKISLANSCLNLLPPCNISTSPILCPLQLVKPRSIFRSPLETSNPLPPNPPQPKFLNNLSTPPKLSSYPTNFSTQSV